MDNTLSSLITALRPHGISSAKEQAELARAAKRGDETAREKLIIGSTAIVMKLITPWIMPAAGLGLQASDLLTVALYGPDGDGKSGAVRAIDKFDPDRGTRLSTYIAYWVRDALETAFRRATIVATPSTRPRKCRPEITSCAPEDAPEAYSTPTSEEDIDKREVIASVQALILSLPEDQRKVINLIYSRRELSRREAAKELGIELVAFRKLEKLAMRTLKANAKAAGVENPF